MTYPLSTTDLSGSLAQASPRTLPRETSPRRLQRRGSLRNAQPDIAKSAVPASGGLNLAVAIFCGKTLAAALIALFISFWLALDEPYWSLLTVFIVAQPDSGLVLAKGFYRLCGTAVGILVTTALVFGLAQYGELFIASLAAWIGVCAFAARAKKFLFVRLSAGWLHGGNRRHPGSIEHRCGLYPHRRSVHRDYTRDRLHGAGEPSGSPA